MICIAAAGVVLALAADDFTLRWQHSVTHTRWEERWQASPEGLRPVEAFVQSPGPGMEIPDHARRVRGGWRYSVDMPPQKEVLLASSGTTGSGWTLCAAGHCLDLGQRPDEPLRLWQAEECGALSAE